MRLAAPTAAALFLTTALFTSACGPACPPGFDQCGDTCVDGDHDPAHCGACDNACTAPTGGFAACISGACAATCPAGLVACDGVCLGVKDDEANCGSCGAACTAPGGGSAQCTNGRCERACPSGSIECNGVCTSVLDDEANCGRCGATCDAPVDGSATCSDGECVKACESGASLCGNACVDLDTDKPNCGACGRTCSDPAGGSAACVDGDCVVLCAEGFTRCGDLCFDLDQDDANCGFCGRACGAPVGGIGQCLGGECVETCSRGQVNCDGTCVDVLADEANCGYCGRACDPVEGRSTSCEQGACVATCNAPTAECERACVDRASDPDHCGTCGNRCESAWGGGASCVESQCVKTCPGGLTLCGDTCVDTLSDVSRCGTCTNACAAPVGGLVRCSNSNCVTSCPAGRTDCNGTCVDTATDESHCSACNSACSGPTGGSAACRNSTCVPSCPEGRVLCGNACVDPKTDGSHCGGCGQACTAATGGTVQCTAGRCVRACAANQAECGGACTDVVANVANCGACGNVCPAPTGGTATCVNRLCGQGCPATQSVCNGACVALGSDVTNCGTCGLRCNFGETCQSGNCLPAAPTVTSLVPGTMHASVAQPLEITGDRFVEPLTATLVQGATRTPLTSVLTSERFLRATAPSGLATGTWSLEVTGPNGTATFPNALTVSTDPFRIELIESGQGDAGLLTFPGGRTMLLDGGIAGTAQNRLNSRLVAAPHYYMISHYHSDHLAGLYEVLSGPDQLPNTPDDRDPQIMLLDHGGGTGCSSTLCRNFDAIRSRLATIGKARAAVPGETLELGGGVRMLVGVSRGKTMTGERIFFTDENETSVGGVFEFAGFRYYSAGDATGGPIAGCNVAVAGNLGDVETPFALAYGDVDVAKASHHGSCTGFPQGFTGVIRPTVALVSEGQDNQYCHPSRRVLFNLDAIGTRTFMTNPGTINVNNPSNCPLTVRPASVATTYGTLRVDVPATGNYSVTVTPAAGSPLTESYTRRRPLAPLTPLARSWPAERDAVIVGDANDQPRDAITLELAVTPRHTTVYLLPWAALTDATRADLVAGRPVAARLAATVTLDGRRITVTPATTLAADTAYALVLPATIGGFTRPLVLPFKSEFYRRTHATVTLQPIPRGPANGVPLNVAFVEVDFGEPVTGVTPQSLFLEELNEGLDRVIGTVTMSDGNRRARLTLPQTSRTGPGGACEALCPGLTYTVRVTGLVKDAQDEPVDVGNLPTFPSAACRDAAPPSISATTTRAFATAETVQWTANEPLAGELRVAPVATFATDCGGVPTANCLRSPITLGNCTSNACTPGAITSCELWATARGLTPNTAYTWSIRAYDAAGTAVTATNNLTTTPPAAFLTFTEALADVPAGYTEPADEFFEVVNTGTSSIDLCTLKLARTTATTDSRNLCGTGHAPVILAPGQLGLIGGRDLCIAGASPCYAYPAGTPIARGSASGLYGSSGLSNSGFPDAFITDTAANVIARLPGSPNACGDGRSWIRTSLESPDLVAAFACGVPTPGSR